MTNETVVTTLNTLHKKLRVFLYLEGFRIDQSRENKLLVQAD